MKASVEVAVLSQSAMKSTENRICKTARRERDVSQEEMQQLLGKLKDLVPNMPKNKRLSKLEIIQNVIDYIFDLQIALESDSVSRKSDSSSYGSTYGSDSVRQPLGVLSPATNSAYSLQEEMSIDISPSHLPDLQFLPPRPISC
ncbi:protein extra-macrochaetae-like [Limulus polyphemus]|uniref:Protein extra-macrochaetae-like n=1 Tax=Limulus polyphemus TaxID=6850 RepID=A0ABM1B9Y7_LIMPO|nr:protein extra-macrochaetae-like [Limulus polyphemus]